jgi:NADH-quinone oxidoreductase subunit J
MNLHTIIFYTFISLAGLSAISILFTSNVFKGALCLLVCLISLAAIYIFAFAEFVAVAQVMIYAGGIVIVIIFGIMLTSKLSGKALKVENGNIFSGALASTALLILLIKLFSHPFRSQETAIRNQNAVTETGMNLMGPFLLPFELAGILLLIALIGAAIISTTKQKPGNP